MLISDYTDVPAFFIHRPWGKFFSFGDNIKCTAKVLIVEPGESLSLQYHVHRDQLYYLITPFRISYSLVPCPDNVDEQWLKTFLFRDFDAPANTTFYFKRRCLHRAQNITDSVGYIAEVAYGTNDETDIVRLEDLYGRH